MTSTEHSTTTMTADDVARELRAGQTAKVVYADRVAVRFRLLHIVCRNRAARAFHIANDDVHLIRQMLLNERRNRLRPVAVPASRRVSYNQFNVTGGKIIL